MRNTNMILENFRNKKTPVAGLVMIEDFNDSRLSKNHFGLPVVWFKQELSLKKDEVISKISKKFPFLKLSFDENEKKLTFTLDSDHMNKLDLDKQNITISKFIHFVALFINDVQKDIFEYMHTSMDFFNYKLENNAEKIGFAGELFHILETIRNTNSVNFINEWQNTGSHKDSLFDFQNEKEATEIKTTSMSFNMAKFHFMTNQLCSFDKESYKVCLVDVDFLPEKGDGTTTIADLIADIEQELVSYGSFSVLEYFKNICSRFSYTKRDLHFKLLKIEEHDLVINREYLFSEYMSSEGNPVSSSKATGYLLEYSDFSGYKEWLKEKNQESPKVPSSHYDIDIHMTA